MVQLFELMGKRNNSKLITYFLGHPTLEIYPQKLHKELKMSRKGMFDALDAAYTAGILEADMIGRTRIYRLRRVNPEVRQLKILYSIDGIMKLLEKLEGVGVEVYLYGSAARGEDTEKSDIDLLLIGDAGRSQIIGKLGKDKRLKPLFLTFMEYSSLARKDPAFYNRLEKDRIRLM